MKLAFCHMKVMGDAAAELSARIRREDEKWAAEREPAACEVPADPDLEEEEIAIGEKLSYRLIAINN